jgi:hypothetical protein
VYIVAGLSGPVIFVMYVTGVEMMMEVMVGHLVSAQSFQFMQWHWLSKHKSKIIILNEK